MVENLILSKDFVVKELSNIQFEEFKKYNKDSNK